MKCDRSVAVPRHLLAILIIASAALAPGLYAKKKEKGNRDEGDQERRTAVFRSEHHRVISDYYRADPGGLPPGLAKRGGDLPPGLAKQLRRNGRLPPGLEKKLVPFPPELDRRFPPLPPYYRRGFVGDRAIIYDQRTGGILDSLQVNVIIRR
jgi:hypothetical protein